MTEQAVATQKVPSNSENELSGTREDSRHLTPPVDIFEKQEELVILVDMPGVQKENVDVNLDEDILTIKGTVTDRPNFGDSIHEEFDLLNYFRQFRLGEEIDQEKISAELKNGVLNIRLPKAEKAKPRKIEISSE